MSQANSITLVQTGSPIRRPAKQAEILRGLGLKRVGDRSTLKDTVEVRGMLAKVAHMVRIEEAK
jgi:large subunit ribosomal protein L30